MHQFARLACGRDVVVPAACDVGLGVEPEDAGGDGVAVMVVVKQPAVKAGLADCGLDCVDSAIRSRISQILADSTSSTLTPYTLRIFATNSSFVWSSWKSQRLDSSEMNAHLNPRTRSMKSCVNSG
jgi:hypothetical protein